MLCRIPDEMLYLNSRNKNSLFLKNGSQIIMLAFQICKKVYNHSKERVERHIIK
jgi:hypothetical protein